MRDTRDVGVVALLLVAVSCLTVFFLKVAEPTGTVVEMLFPRVAASVDR